MNISCGTFQGNKLIQKLGSFPFSFLLLILPLCTPPPHSFSSSFPFIPPSSLTVARLSILLIPSLSISLTQCSNVMEATLTVIGAPQCRPEASTHLQLDEGQLKAFTCKVPWRGGTAPEVLWTLGGVPIR